MTLEDATTEIETIRTIDQDGTERIYDLNGRRIERILERGVYIKNGKKYMSK